MAGDNLPAIGSEHVFRGVNVRVVDAAFTAGRPSKEGIPAGRVSYARIADGDPAPFEAVRLADFRKGCQ